MYIYLTYYIFNIKIKNVTNFLVILMNSLYLSYIFSDCKLVWPLSCFIQARLSYFHPEDT